LRERFTGIAWENGAVLSVKGTDELYLPFGHVDPQLVNNLELAGVPLERGLAIVATWTPHEETVWHILQESGSEAVIVHNKGAVMVLPPGTTKGTGLERLLELCGFSPRNLVSFGDAENDLSLLQVGETGIAVADAVPSLKEVADLVTSQPGPTGVLEALETYWLSNHSLNVPAQPKRLIPLGKDEAGNDVSLPGAMLVSGNLGVFGDSGSGKSWVTGLLAEGMHLAGYQVLLIDPEGDFRGLRSLPGIIALTGDATTLPTPSLVAMLLEEASISVVLDLCLYPLAQREFYITELLHALRPMREHKFRPHWIVLEEAQSFLPPAGNAVLTALQPMLDKGGLAFVSYRPDRLAEPVLEALNRCLAARLSEPESIQVIERLIQAPSAELLARTPTGQIWLCGQGSVRLRPAARRVPHIRHLYKYLDTPLPRHKRFSFRSEQGYLGLEAASLFEFKEIIPTLAIESLAYHLTRGHFANWVRSSLDDEILAAHLEKLAHREDLVGETLRQALSQRVTDRYAEIYLAGSVKG